MADTTNTPEKVLQTRVKLKIDTFANWTKDADKIETTHKNAWYVLKRGEIGLCEISDTSSGLAQKPPMILFKVGDGKTPFKDLNWGSALAADVYDWAKRNEVKVEGTGNAITGATISADGYLTFTKDTTFVTQEQLDNLVGNLDADTNTQYSFDASTTNKLIIKKKEVTETDFSDYLTIDIVTPAGLTAALTNYYTKEEIDNKNFASKVEAQSYANAKDEAIAEAKKAGTDAADALTAYKEEITAALKNKQNTIPAETYDAYGAAAEALEAAKKYADDNDANTQYGIEYDSATKKIKLTSDTSKTEIDATDFIKDGMIESVVLSDNNLIITWNTDSNKETNVTTIPLTGLIDVYTGVDETTVKVDVSADNKISAEVKSASLKNEHIAPDAAIAKTKLSTDVQTTLDKADSALQEITTTTGAGLIVTNKNHIDIDSENITFVFDCGGAE